MLMTIRTRRDGETWTHSRLLQHGVVVLILVVCRCLASERGYTYILLFTCNLTHLALELAH
jgi:hypothetical protein